MLPGQSAFMPAIVHGLGAAPTEPPPITDAPFMNQITAWPLLALYQRMSAKPSLLKSPVPATAQSVVTVPGEPLPITNAAPKSQTTTWPLLPLRQRMSVIADLTHRPKNAAGQSCIGCEAALSIASIRLLFLGRRRVENAWVCSNCGLTIAGRLRTYEASASVLDGFGALMQATGPVWKGAGR